MKTNIIIIALLVITVYFTYSVITEIQEQQNMFNLLHGK